MNIAIPGGALVNLNNLQTFMSLHDLLISLDNICRYCGRTGQFYSVLNHSLSLGKWTLETTRSRDLTIQALAHDFSEAYIGDLPASLKLSPGMAAFREFEKRFDQTIWTHYAGFRKLDPFVMDADSKIAINEMRTFNLADNSWLKKPGLDNIHLESFGPGECVDRFITFCTEVDLEVFTNQLELQYGFAQRQFS